MKLVIAKYYELENTINERSSIVHYTNSHLDLVKKEMKKYSNWWCSKGTGTIYEIKIIEDMDSGEITKERQEVYKK